MRSHMFIVKCFESLRCVSCWNMLKLLDVSSMLVVMSVNIEVIHLETVLSRE